MILFLYGADTFRSRQYLNEQVKRFKTLRDPQGFNVIFLDGKKETLEKILTEAASAPFLGEKRMVIIEDVLASKDKEYLSGLIAFIKKIKEPGARNKEQANVMIFWQGEPISKVKEAKDLETLLKKEEYAKEFPLLAGAKLVNWIEAEVRSRDGSIEREAANYLAQNAGADMWHLNTLIDQLVAYAGNKSVTKAGVDLFVDEKLDDNIFSMVDAIVQGNRKFAFKLLEHQRQIGEEDGKIFGLLVWQFRILLEMGDLLERENNLTSDAMAKTIGLHPFVAKKNMAAVRRTPLAKLQKIYNNLLEIDIKTKTGVAPQPVLIDLFVGSV